MRVGRGPTLAASRAALVMYFQADASGNGVRFFNDGDAPTHL
eukprot:COSAG06_NODE_49050_length_328_cov_0.620087_1_plen_41_part_10